MPTDTTPCGRLRQVDTPFSIIYSNANVNIYNIPNMTNIFMTASCTSQTNGLQGTGNTTNPPQFVNVAGRDYHLKSTSPCVNTGMNQLWWMTGATDLDGQRRIDPVSGIVDMGCYEYATRGTMFIIR